MKIQFKEIAGFYKARLSKIKEERNIYGSYIRLIFTIIEGDLKNYRFSGCVKPTPYTTGKFYRWVTNLLGYEPEGEFCIENVIGKECLVHLTKHKNFYIVNEVSMKRNG